MKSGIDGQSTFTTRCEVADPLEGVPKTKGIVSAFTPIVFGNDTNPNPISVLA